MMRAGPNEDPTRKQSKQPDTTPHDYEGVPVTLFT